MAPPKRNHFESRSIISYRPPSAAPIYSRLEEERTNSRLSGSVFRGDAQYESLDRAASRMSRRSIGPPRPPPPTKSRPDLAIIKFLNNYHSVFIINNLYFSNLFFLIF